MGAAEDLVGRDAELTAIDAVLTRLARGHGGTLAVTGPAGIGKTAVARELRRRAEAVGAEVVVGRSYRFQSGLSYAPLVDAFARVVRDDAPDGDLVRDLTSLGQLFDGLPMGVVPVDPLLGRTRLATSLVTLAHRIAGRRPTVLVLDDVQWADEATVALLPLLAADLDAVPFLLVLVARVPGTAADSIRAVDAARSLATQEIELTPLDRRGVAALVRTMLDGVYPDELDQIVFDRSGGTPLFVREIVSALVNDRWLLRAGSGWRLDADQLPSSATGTELMRARLSGCTADELAILAPLALHGEPIPERVLVALGIDSTLLRPLAARTLATTETSAGQRVWGLAHPVLADVLADQIPEAERQDWHEQLARSFAATDPDRYAHHLLHAGERGLRVAGSGDELAAEFVAAAARGERQGSLLLATRYLTASLELLRSASATPLHADAAQRLARVWSARGHHDVAAPLAREALDEHLELGDVRAALETAAVVGEIVFYLGDTDFAWLDSVIEAALASDDAELILRARYREFFERARRFSDRPDPSELLRVARGLAADGGRTSDQRADHASRIARAVLVVAERQEPAATIERAEQIRTAALDTDDDPWFSQRCWNLYLDACLLRGDWRQVESAMEEITAFTARHDLLENWRVRVGRSQQLLFTGRPRAGREVEVFYRGLVSPNLRVSSILLALHTACDAMLGDVDALRHDLELAAELDPQVDERDRHSLDAVATARLLAAAGLGDRDLIVGCRWPSIRPMTGSPLLSFLGRLRAACLLGDAEAAAPALIELRQMDPHVRLGPGALAALFDASVSVEAGREVDDHALRAAGEVFQRLGMPVFAAECALVRHRIGEVGTEELAEVHDRLLHDPDVDDGAVDAAIAARLGRTHAIVQDDSGLSKREREVAELVMEGLTNREVADRLFISIRTVTSHLDHIYTKLGIGSRQELADRLRP